MKLAFLSALLLAATTSVASAKGSSAPVAPESQVTQLAPRQTQRSIVRQILAKRRATQLKRLRAYRDSRNFPLNEVRPGYANIMIDGAGRFCAAANLMRHDGLGKLVRKTAKTDNFMRFGSVRSGPLLSWMLTSGITQEEIARIQEPDFFVDDEPSDPRQDQIAREQQRLYNHFTAVLAELQRNEHSSLNVAVKRVMSNPKLVASLLSPPPRGKR